MIDLHERLSEYSYGYGVTRETELNLSAQGIRAVPFLPSLIHEGDLGFDVGFQRPGAPLLLQFKLGEQLTKFVRSKKTDPKPELDRPFWRFAIDTAEPDGQFETLLKAEHDGAEVYYTAPRFSNWAHYAALFESGAVRESSLFVRPSEIRTALDDKGATDGTHRVVYDCQRVHVCSKATEVKQTRPEEVDARVAMLIRERREPVGVALERLLHGLDDRTSIRRERPRVAEANGEKVSVLSGAGPSRRAARAQRRRRIDALLERAESRGHAVAAAIGIELWAMGIQLVLAVDETAEPQGH